jgi:hypothetical protein
MQTQFPARVYKAVDRMIAAAEADKLGAVIQYPGRPDEWICVYRLKNPGDGRDECFCAIGAQLSPISLDGIEMEGANAGVSAGRLSTNVSGFSLFDEAGLTDTEANMLQRVHDDIYKDVRKDGMTRADANNLFIERLRALIAGDESVEGVMEPLADVVDFERE